jgi:pimeloyl-ACP methyl ester carboxylesterase
MDHWVFELPGAGLTLTAEAAGPEDGPLVLLVHGGGQTRGSWGTALDALAERGFRAVALDQRGHGDSEWSAHAAYEPSDFGADLCQAVPALGRGPVVLVGASMGGWASMLATPVLGELVSGVVLVDVVPQLRLEGTERIVEFMRSAPDGFPNIEAAADAVAAYLPHRPKPRSTDGLKKNLRWRDGRWHWHWDPAFLTKPEDDPFVRVDKLEQAAVNLEIPILLIRGKLSDVVSTQGVQDFLAKVPRAEFVELSEAGHMAAGDDNDAFSDVVVRFVAS